MMKLHDRRQGSQKPANGSACGIDPIAAAGFARTGRARDPRMRTMPGQAGDDELA
jgi:hypothetical protein